VFSKKHPVTKQTVLSSVTFLSLKMNWVGWNGSSKRKKNPEQ